MKAIRFLNTAKKLKENTPEEDARTSISRSYYAIILLVKEKLGQEAIEINRNQTHSLHNIFYGCKKDKVKAIGGHISTLHDARIKADYKLSEKVEKTLAGMNYRLACKAKEAITSLFEGDDKKDVVEQAQKFLA
jgi:HEPN domain-containing protein